MSTVSSISRYTASTLLSSVTSSSDIATNSTGSTTNSATTTDTSSSNTSSNTEAYSIEITPALIKAALQNTYISQLFDAYQDSTISNAVLYDYYNNLSASALNYVVSSDSNSSTSTSSTSSSIVDILA